MVAGPLQVERNLRKKYNPLGLFPMNWCLPSSAKEQVYLLGFLKEGNELAQLIVVEGPNRGTTYNLEAPRCTLGRGEECSIILPDRRAGALQAEIRKRRDWMVFYNLFYCCLRFLFCLLFLNPAGALQAEIRKRRDWMEITNLDPRRHILVNGEVQKKAKLQNGDCITIADTTLVFSEDPDNFWLLRFS